MRVLCGRLWLCVKSGILCREHGSKTPFYKVQELYQLSHNNVINIPIETEECLRVSGG